MTEQEFRGPGHEERGHFADYLREIWRRKWVVLFVALVVFGGWMWNTLRTVPLYEAVLTMQLGVPVGSAFLDPRLTLSRPLGLEPEMEILKSRTVAEKTAIRLQRHYALRNIPSGISVHLSGVTAGEEAKPGWYTITYSDALGNYQVRDPDGHLAGVGQSGQPFEAGAISFTISSKPNPNTGSSIQVLIHNLADVATALRGQISMSPIKDTHITALRVRASDPRDAARLANTFAETYVDFAREQKLQQVLSLREFVDKQIKTYREDIDKTQEELASRTPRSTLDLFRKGQEIETNREQDPRFGLARRLLDLEVKRATLQYAYTPNHRDMTQLDQEIAAVQSRLSEQLVVGKQDISLQNLLRETGIKISMYGYLLQKQQEARLAEASELGSARIIDRALTPKAPISPDVSRSVKAGGLAGLCLGIGLALLLGYLDRSVKNIKDIEDRLGIPVFGVIPEIDCEDRGNRLRFWSRKRESTDPARYLLGANGTEARVMEAYRTLRTNIRFAIPEAPARVFLFTSSGPGEGKSLTIANLAIAMSQKRRILVVDCDLRRPAQHKLFGLASELGLSDVLVKDLTWREVVRPTRFESLELISFGQLTPDPAELLGGEAMRAVFEEAKQHYDLILLDSPPLLPYTDACVLAPLVNGVFIVARAGVTTTEAIARGQAMLSAVNAKVIGTILNGASSADGSGYGNDYYYYDTQESGGPLGKARRISKRILSQVWSGLR